MTGWPLDRNIIRRGALGNTYGMVRRRPDGSPKPHQGWDFYAAKGTPCYAVGEGKVVAVVRGKDYGLTVVHSFKRDGAVLYAAFCHLDSASVTPGERVVEGAVIGLTGDSGNAKGMTGPDLHLHFEVRSNPAPGLGLSGRIDPLKVYPVCPLDKEVLRK